MVYAVHTSSSMVARVHELLGSLPPKINAGRDASLSADGPADPLDVLEAELKAGALHPARFNAPIAAVPSTLDTGCYLATVDAEGERLLLVSRLGRRIQLEDNTGTTFWMTPDALADRLELAGTDQSHAWLTVGRDDTKRALISGHLSPWRNTYLILKGERSNIGAIVIYAVGVGLLSLTLPIAVQTLVNTVAFGQLLQPIVVLTLMLAAGLVFAATLTALQAWTVEVVQRRFFVRLVSDLADRMPRAHVSAFDRGTGPELLNRFFDVFTAQKAASSLLLGGVGALLTALVGVIVLAFYHPILLGFGLVLTLAVVVALPALGRGATNSTIAESKAKYAVAGWLQEMARHPFALKTTGGSEYAKGRLDELASSWLQQRGVHFRVFYRQLLGALGLQVIAHAGLLGVGGWLVTERELSIGQLVAAELIVTAIVVSLSKLGGKLEVLYDLIAAVDKLSALLALPLEEEGGSDPLQVDGPAEIELRNVSSDDGRVQGLSLVVPAGRRASVLADRRTSVALVDLLFGLRSPAKGTVLIDGQDLRDLDRKSLRSKVGVVREPEVLPGTIADNIRSVGRHVPTSQVWALLEEVGLADVVSALPKGLRTELSPTGFPLDRLESIRLTLARALAALPSVLMLDGVLDALPEAERESLLDRVARGRTTIVMTQERAIAAHCKETSITLGLASR